MKRVALVLEKYVREYKQHYINYPQCVLLGRVANPLIGFNPLSYDVSQVTEINPTNFYQCFEMSRHLLVSKYMSRYLPHLHPTD